jgi:hypothetical protein
MKKRKTDYPAVECSDSRLSSLSLVVRSFTLLVDQVRLFGKRMDWSRIGWRAVGKISSDLCW